MSEISYILYSAFM